MSEVVISRRGSGSGKGVFMQEIISSNVVWKMPKSVVNNTVHVRIFGAGGCGTNEKSSEIFTGGSGWMNNDYVKLTPGEKVNITIGTANVRKWDANAGGPSSFGTYLTANGGAAFGDGGAGGIEGDGYQFGGGGACYYNIPGNGGPWGGGGGGQWKSQRGEGYAGNGGIYGGGGGTSTFNCQYGMVGGIGGRYGGHGGYGCQGSGYATTIQMNQSEKSEFGGLPYNISVTSSGRNYYITMFGSSNGTNTSGWTNIAKDEITNEYMSGYGINGISLLNGIDQTYLTTDGHYICGIGGAGGFGGNGGNGGNRAGGGGGGYGSNGGNGYEYYSGGGGGYGGDGGDAYSTKHQHGGGGGYGKCAKAVYGAGGGYYCPGGGKNRTGGGGGIGIWDENQLVATYGSGGYNYGPPEGGVCIIQYYLK